MGYSVLPSGVQFQLVGLDTWLVVKALIIGFEKRLVPQNP